MDKKEGLLLIAILAVKTFAWADEGKTNSINALDQLTGAAGSAYSKELPEAIKGVSTKRIHPFRYTVYSCDGIVHTNYCEKALLIAKKYAPLIELAGGLCSRPPDRAPSHRCVKGVGVFVEELRPGPVPLGIHIAMYSGSSAEKLLAVLPKHLDGVPVYFEQIDKD